MALLGTNGTQQKNRDAATRPTNAASTQINMIGEGTIVEGTFISRGDVRISGRVNGRVRVDGKVIVAQEGVIDGHLEATSADVAGSVKGDIRVSERLVLKSTAIVDGNIYTARIVVEEGAVFGGSCEVGQLKEEPLVELEQHVRTELDEITLEPH